MARVSMGCILFLVCSGALHAQSQLRIYGLIDTAVETINHVGSTGARLNRMPNLTGSAPSRLGFRGQEDLGHGLKAAWVLEMGLASDAGGFNQGGRPFGRQSFVSLKGAWGELGLGRQYTMLYWASLRADLIGASLHSMASLDSYFPNARADNAITYQATWSGFTVGGHYSLGRDTVNAGPSPAGTNCPGENASDHKACNSWSALLKYDADQWGVAVAVDTIHGGENAFAGLTNSSLKDRRSLINGYVSQGAWKLGAGFMRRDNDGAPATPRSSIWYVGLRYKSGRWLYDGQLNQLRFHNSADKAQLWVFRGTYQLSTRTALYGTVGHVRNHGAAAFGASGGGAGGLPMPGQNQTGLGVGIRHTF